jgi:predicted transcriptional regulator
LLTGNMPQHTKLVRMLARYIEMLVPLPYIFNIKNIIQLMKDVPNISFDQDLKFFSFDITNMDGNITIRELIKIIEIMCKQMNLTIEFKKEIIKKCLILTKQNYFQYTNLQYIQEHVLAIGAPNSTIFSTIYLQHLESTKIFDILIKYHLIGYFRYADDVLIIYKNEVTNILEVLESFNIITHTMPFTMEEEGVKNRVKFLDNTISKIDHKISFNVYRKSTATYIVIPNDFCHPTERKLTTVRYLINRISTYPMNETNKRKENMTK